MPEAATPHFAWDLIDGVAVVDILSRELNQPHEAEELDAQLRALIQTGQVRKILLNFEQTESMSSTAYATLLAIGKELHEAGGQMRACGMEPMVRLGADIIMLKEYIPVHDDEASAMSALVAHPTGQ